MAVRKLNGYSMDMHTCSHIQMMFTFSMWHIPQSGNDNLLDTGLMVQATTKESRRQ